MTVCIYATHPFHFLPIIDHLQKLHSNGFVHGDIRAYNMLLKYDTTSVKADQCTVDCSSNETGNSYDGCLIDFDFGGTQNEVVYPKGYKHLLDDGKRPGKKRNKITIMDDWKSLIGLIFHTHVFVKKEGVQLTEHQESLIYRMRNELELYGNTKVHTRSNDPLMSNFKKPAESFKEVHSSRIPSRQGFANA